MKRHIWRWLIAGLTTGSLLLFAGAGPAAAAGGSASSSTAATSTTASSVNHVGPNTGPCVTWFAFYAHKNSSGQVVLQSKIPTVIYQGDCPNANPAQALQHALGSTVATSTQSQTTPASVPTCAPYMYDVASNAATGPGLVCVGKQDAPGYSPGLAASYEYTGTSSVTGHVELGLYGSGGCYPVAAIKNGGTLQLVQNEGTQVYYNDSSFAGSWVGTFWQGSGGGPYTDWGNACIQFS